MKTFLKLALCAVAIAGSAVFSGCCHRYQEAVLLKDQLQPQTPDAVRIEPSLRDVLKTKRSKNERLAIVLAYPEITEREKAPVPKGGIDVNAFDEQDRSSLRTDSAFAPIDQYRKNFFIALARELSQRGYSVKEQPLPVGKSFDDYVAANRGDVAIVVDFQPYRIRATTYRNELGEIGNVQDDNPARGLSYFYVTLTSRFQVIHGGQTTHGGSITFSFTPPAAPFYVDTCDKTFRFSERTKWLPALTWTVPKSTLAASEFAGRIAAELERYAK